MASLTNEQLAPVVKTIAEAENIIDPVIEFKYSEERGSGYIGIVNAIAINGKNKKLDLIVKHAPVSEKLRAQAPIREAFIREIYFYDVIMPAFVKFQTDRGIESPFDNVAKCYATVSDNGHELLILENLKTIGFDVFNRKKTMNHEHVEFVFKQYGKLHALSYAMKDQDLENYTKLSAPLTDIMKQFFETGNMMNTVSMICDKVTKSFDTTTDKHLLERYTNFTNNISSVVNMYVKDDYSIIIHGDCWCNNMMFKYEDAEKAIPLGVTLIDFQVLTESSPVIDLSYFFYVCVSKDIMDDLDKYLKIYHNSLSNHLRELGSDPEILFPYSELLNQWKKYSKFGLMMSSMLIKMMLSDSEETPNLAEEAETGDMADAFNYVGIHDQEYYRRVKDVVQHFCERDFF